MKVLWARGSASVHEIHTQLLPWRPLAHTTVMTVMVRLLRKGLVERERRGRAHLYRPRVDAQVVREHAVERLLHDFFHDSREGFREYLERGRIVSAAPPLAPEALPEPESAVPPEDSIDPSLL